MPSVQFRIFRGMFRVLPARMVAYTKRPGLIGRLRGKELRVETYQPVAKKRAAQIADFARIPTAKDCSTEQVDAGGVPGLWVRHEKASRDKTILYMHGGGYVYLSPVTHRHIAAAISRESGAQVLLIDYRMGPEDPFPAAVDDAVTAWKWLLTNGADPKRTVAAGDSAGGGLTVALMLKLKALGEKLPAAGVCISPWTDLALTGDSIVSKAKADPMLTKNDLLHFAGCYLGKADPKNPLASPLFGDLTGLPPLFIQVGSDEILLDDATRLHDRAKKAGVQSDLEVWPEMIHVWHGAAPLVPESVDAIRKFAVWLEKIWGK